MAVCFAVVLAPVVFLRASVVQGSAGAQITHFNTAAVNGRQAVVWVESSGVLKYTRATDPNGRSWDAVALTLDDDAGAGAVLEVVNGNPAVCYYKPVAKKLAFRRAVDPAGSAWNTAVLIDIGLPSDPPQRLTLDVAGGNPFLTYAAMVGTFAYPKCVAASNPTGSAWGTPVSIQSGQEPAFATEVVDGLPAYAHPNSGGVYIRRASNPAGTAWGSDTRVVAGTTTTQDFVMGIMSGNPAIGCFYAGSGTHIAVRFMRATNPQGTGWGTLVDLVNYPSGPGSLSMESVDGRPAIAVFNPTSRELACFEGKDTGGTVWASSTVMTGDQTRNPQFPQLFDAGGLPALMYLAGSRFRIEVVRAISNSTSPDGLLWPPFPYVSIDGVLQTGVAISRTFASSPGASQTAAIEIGLPYYTSSPNLDISALNITGPDAGDFSVVSQVPVLVPQGAKVPLNIKFAPRTTGSKTAILEIVSNAASPDDHLIVNLEGVSAGPAIIVRRSGGAPLTDGAALTFPVTDPANPASIDFTVTNQQGIELSGLAVTIDGQDAAEYSVSNPPASALPSGASTSFTIRHAPQTGGGRVATLHITSNLVSGPLNPFEIVLRMLAGELDSSFHPSGANVSSLAVQPDGRILAGGAPFIIALNPDGSFDDSFTPPLISDGSVNAIAVLRDGRLLIGGSFAQVGGLPRPALARLMNNGAVDPSFDAHMGTSVSCLSIQPDGKILAGGDFQIPAASAQRWLVRLQPDGALDQSFQPVLDNAVSSMALQPDGKLLAGGAFHNVSSAPAPFLARLNPDGTRDTFSTLLDQPVQALALRPAGGILAGHLSGGLRLLLPNGAFPSGISAVTANGTIHSLALQTDGKCFVAGAFTQLGGEARPYLGQITAAGGTDLYFVPRPDNPLRAVALQADGNLLLAGTFSKINSTPASFVARLLNAPATYSLYRTAGTVRWMRGGSAPEVSSVTFEVQAEGASAWQMLGSAHLIPGGWELSGLTLPSAGRLRAQGRAGGSLHELVAPLMTHIEFWRIPYFSTSAATGPSADDADPDHDGLTNFTEYAFGLNPVDHSSNSLPAFKHDGTSFTATFTTPQGREDVIYSAEYSASMKPGTWVSVPDTGVAPAHAFRVSATAPGIFLRWRLSLPN